MNRTYTWFVVSFAGSRGSVSPQTPVKLTSTVAHTQWVQYNYQASKQRDSEEHTRGKLVDSTEVLG
jgi:hypothetical protein